MAKFRRWIHVSGELSNMGDGLRLVDADIGWKWVRVKETHGESLRRRIRRAKWNDIVRRTDKRGVWSKELTKYSEPVRIDGK